jgi:hypothetical protein
MNIYKISFHCGVVEIHENVIAAMLQAAITYGEQKYVIPALAGEVPAEGVFMNIIQCGVKRPSFSLARYGTEEDPAPGLYALDF